MTHFDAYEPTFPEEQQRTSGLAIGSLVCSLIFFCPLTTIIGPILGIAALAQIGGNPTLKGRGLALAGIVLGVVFTFGWAYGGYRVWMFAQEYGEFVMEGPDEALRAGFAGDYADFRDAFHGRGAALTDAEAEAFIENLRERYGEFISASLRHEDADDPMPRPGQARVVFPYRLEFTQQTVNADVEIIFADERTGRLMKKIGSIEIRDAERGDLTYPPVAPREQRQPAAPPGNDVDEYGGEYES